MPHAKLVVMKPGRKYCIINTDEPYAKAIFEVLKAGQIAKGEWPEGDITFEEWKESIQSYAEEEQRKEVAVRIVLLDGGIAAVLIAHQLSDPSLQEELRRQTEESLSRGREIPKPTTLFDVVMREFQYFDPMGIDENCPFKDKFQDVFKKSGYVQPLSCPNTKRDKTIPSCADCWARPAIKNYPSEQIEA